jgi:hypothetical protein
MIIAARETSSNTDDQQYQTLPDWISIRGYSDTSAVTRYYYPFGALLTVTNAN